MIIVTLGGSTSATIEAVAVTDAASPGGEARERREADGDAHRGADDEEQEEQSSEDEGHGSDVLVLGGRRGERLHRREVRLHGVVGRVELAAQRGDELLDGVDAREAHADRHDDVHREQRDVGARRDGEAGHELARAGGQHHRGVDGDEAEQAGRERVAERDERAAGLAPQPVDEERHRDVLAAPHRDRDREDRADERDRDARDDEEHALGAGEHAAHGVARAHGTITSFTTSPGPSAAMVVVIAAPSSSDVVRETSTSARSGWRPRTSSAVRKSSLVYIAVPSSATSRTWSCPTGTGTSWLKTATCTIAPPGATASNARATSAGTPAAMK